MHTRWFSLSVMGGALERHNNAAPPVDASQFTRVSLDAYLQAVLWFVVLHRPDPNPLGQLGQNSVQLNRYRGCPRPKLTFCSLLIAGILANTQRTLATNTELQDSSC